MSVLVVLSLGVGWVAAGWWKAERTATGPRDLARGYVVAVNDGDLSGMTARRCPVSLPPERLAEQVDALRRLVGPVTLERFDLDDEMNFELVVAADGRRGTLIGRLDGDGRSSLRLCGVTTAESRSITIPDAVDRGPLRRSLEEVASSVGAPIPVCKEDVRTDVLDLETAPDRAAACVIEHPNRMQARNGAEALMGDHHGATVSVEMAPAGVVVTRSLAFDATWAQPTATPPWIDRCVLRFGTTVLYLRAWVARDDNAAVSDLARRILAALEAPGAPSLDRKPT